MLRSSLALLLFGCSVATAPAHDSWCIEGASEPERGVIENALAEWQDAGATFALGDCARRIQVVDELDHMGYFDGRDIQLLRPTTGTAADPAILRWAALHELGHALALPHSEHEEDVMYAYNTMQLHLTQRDREALWTR